MKWFGQHFAPVCDDTEEAPVPEGQPCHHCRDLIVRTDKGFLIPLMDGDQSTMVPEHLECFLRQIVGSVGHQQHRCLCYGSTDTSEEGMSRHEAALAAQRYFDRMRGMSPN